MSKSSWSAVSWARPTLLVKYSSNAPPAGAGVELDPASPFLAGMAGGLASWKSLNMSFPIFFSLSPSGSKAVKALFSIFGAAGGLGGGREGPCWSGNDPDRKGLVAAPAAPAAGGWQKIWGGDNGGGLIWGGIWWPQALGGMGSPPNADCWGKPNLGPGATTPGMGNMVGAAEGAAHIPAAGMCVGAGGPNWRFPKK